MWLKDSFRNTESRLFVIFCPFCIASLGDPNLRNFSVKDLISSRNFLLPVGPYFSQVSMILLNGIFLTENSAQHIAKANCKKGKKITNLGFSSACTHWQFRPKLLSLHYGNPI